MIVTEFEAKALHCPNGVGLDKCTANKCMAWRRYDSGGERCQWCLGVGSTANVKKAGGLFQKEIEVCPRCKGSGHEERKTPRRGYCGLAGKPEKV